MRHSERARAHVAGMMDEVEIGLDSDIMSIHRGGN